MKRSLRVLAASILLALSPLAAAQVDPSANPGQAQVAARIAGYFGNLAGSPDNSLALVNALRTGTATTLVTTTPGVNGAPPTITEATFTPPTRPMGWGNVRILLALAQDQLTRLGITNPTNEQLIAALNGGDVTVNGTTTTLRGILQMRADGMGMGQIAQASGTKLGPVMSGLKKTAVAPSTETTASATAAKSKGITTAAGATTTKTTGKPDKTLTTGAGTQPGSQASTRGLSTAAGAANSHASRGLVTASGAPTSGGSANAQGHGRGLVTAAGGGAGTTAATARGGGHGQGQGIVTGGGNAAGSTTTAHGGGRGGGNGGGQGSGQGHGKGGGKG